MIQMSYFDIDIDETFLDQTLSPAHQPYVRNAKVAIPLDPISGPKVFTDDNADITVSEVNVGFSRLWSPAGLLGSATFSRFLTGQSYVTADLNGIFTTPIKKLTITFWVKPMSNVERPVLVF